MKKMLQLMEIGDSNHVYPHKQDKTIILNYKIFDIYFLFIYKVD